MKIMNLHNLLMLVFISFALTINASASQTYSPGIDLTVQYNVDENLFEVFAKPDFSEDELSSYVGSIVTVIAPNDDLNVEAVMVESHGYLGTWVAEPKIKDNILSPDLIYYPFIIQNPETGVEFVEGEEYFLFSFALPADCIPKGIRLHNKGVDLNDELPLFPFWIENTLIIQIGSGFGSFPTNLYGTNYSNDGERGSMLAYITPASPIVMEGNSIELTQMGDQADSLFWFASGSAEFDNINQVTVSVSNLADGDTVFVNAFNLDGCMDSDYVVVSVVDSMYEISGMVATPQGNPVIGTEMIMSGDYSKVLTVPDSGKYSFQVPAEYDVTVSAFNNDNWLDGVTTIDLIIAQRHLLQIDTFDSPYYYINADVNKDNQFSTLDLVLTQSLILGIISEIPGNTSWQFIPANFDFENQNPLSVSWPDQVEYPNTHENLVEENWIALKTGDVTGDAAASSLRIVKEHFPLILSDLSTQIEGKSVVEVKAGKDQILTGFQLEWNFDPELLDFDQLDFGYSSLNETDNARLYLDKHRGVIRMVWYNGSGSKVDKGDLLFRMNFFQNRDEVVIGNALKLKHRGELWYSEAYDILIDKPLNIKSQWDKSIANQQNGVFALFQNEPNPFSSETLISFTLPDDMTARLEFFDSKGRLLYAIEKSGIKGMNSIRLDLKDLPSGLIYCRLIAEDNTAVRKMMRVK